MKFIPLQHRVSRPTRKLARHNSSVDIDCDLVLAIFGMEMWRWMVPIVEVDDDAEEPADFRRDE